MAVVNAEPTVDPQQAWNSEYDRQGIPSSHRDEPSGVVVWALENLRHVTPQPMAKALDLGCGTGRNTIALASQGFRATGIDFSNTALTIARSREGAADVVFTQGSVTNPLPVATASQDFAIDVFVYFHQLSDDDRKSYRREIHRALVPGGVLLVSMATQDDGYYASCPHLDSSSLGSSVELRWDPEAQVGNILLTEQDLVQEFSDDFELQMLWRKVKLGRMHGREYLRSTVATLWTAKHAS